MMNTGANVHGKLLPARGAFAEKKLSNCFPPIFSRLCFSLIINEFSISYHY